MGGVIRENAEEIDNAVQAPASEGQETICA